EALWPPAGSRLTAAQERRRKRGPPAVRKTPQQGAERRAGPRHAPVISGDPEMDLSRGRSPGAAFRTSACRRSAPLIFSGERNRDEGYPAPSPKPVAKRWLMART